MTLKLLCDAHDAMRRATPSEALRVEMARFANARGLEHFAYALTISAPSLKPQPYILNGSPPEWLQRDVTQGYFKTDPIIRHATDSSSPAIWSEEIFHDGKSADFWDEACSFGLKAGLSCAVHEQPAVTGTFSLARDRALACRPPSSQPWSGIPRLPGGEVVDRRRPAGYSAPRAGAMARCRSIVRAR